MASTEAVPTFKLNTGASIPAIGLGTWQSDPGEVTKAVECALDAGYKHIDCAFCYQNEDEVGEGLKTFFSKQDKVKREDVFITSKIWCTYHSRVNEAVDLSLKALGVDYLDLYLMHWPCPMNPKGSHPLFPKHPDGSRDLDSSWTWQQTYKDMEKLLATGKVKAIGVANFSKPYLEELLKVCTVTPAVNQIENHPYLPQQEIVDYCHENGIHVTSYSPLGSTGAPLMKDEAVISIAKKHNVHPVTVLLSWHFARGNSVLSKSTNPVIIASNLKLVTLDKEEVDELQQLHVKKGLKRFVFPPFGPDFGFPDTKKTS
ncbi:MAG: hypothetical protein M1834_000403 [Cirrosporium novae-zelandiae]|nr:MAG: hypothetical protein M1834_000403 [Cirrosporium novae-zelandiae]